MMDAFDLHFSGAKTVKTYAIKGLWRGNNLSFQVLPLSLSQIFPDFLFPETFGRYVLVGKSRLAHGRSENFVMSCRVTTTAEKVRLECKL